MDSLQTPRRRRNIQDLVYVGSGFCNPLDRLAFAFFGIVPIAFKRAEFAIHKKQGRHDIVHIEILTDTREHVFQSHCGFLLKIAKRIKPINEDAAHAVVQAFLYVAIFHDIVNIMPDVDELVDPLRMFLLVCLDEFLNFLSVAFLSIRKFFREFRIPLSNREFC